jgi:hypothetical protein
MGYEYAGLQSWGTLEVGIFSINNYILTKKMYIQRFMNNGDYVSFMINMGREYAVLLPRGTSELELELVRVLTLAHCEEHWK